MTSPATMKTSAAEYFASLSPVKNDGSLGRSGSVAGRGGRCHCCPYGYHIDLDFVRYCHTLAKGSEQESATLRKLKQSKRQRRRETHSMEVMLGLTPQQQQQQQQQQLHEQQNGDGPLPEGGQAPTPPPRRNSLKHLHQHLNNSSSSTTTTNMISSHITNIVSSNMTSEHKTSSNTVASPPPPDVVRMANGTAANNNNNNTMSDNKKELLSRMTAIQLQQQQQRCAKLVGQQSAAMGQEKIRGRNKENSSTFNEASDAFQEAMLDFEETLGSSNEGGGTGREARSREMGGAYLPRQRSASTSSGGKGPPPSLDLLQHGTASERTTATESNARMFSTPQRKQGIGSHGGPPEPPVRGGVGGPVGTAMASILAQSAVNRVRSNSVTRSNSLPRYFPDESPHAAWFSKVRPHHAGAGSAGAYNASGGGGGGGGGANYTATGQPGTNTGGGGGLTLREALASLEAARGGGASGRSYCSSPPPPLDDAHSVTSAASQLSTSTLQSIRDQMATGLSRLRELEAEVRNIPQLQREVETLRAERRHLQRAVDAAKKGGQDTLQHSRWSEDEQERHTPRDVLLSSGNRSRRRSQSPVRVNLEEFCSYRRARAGSVSDCSDTESVTSERRYKPSPSNYTSAYTNNDVVNTSLHKNSLFISESTDQHQNQRNETRHGSLVEGGDVAGLLSRRHKRDASTSCKILTRDVGVHHAARVRSVGVMADLLPPPPVVPAQVQRDTVDTLKGMRELKRPSLPTISNVSRATQTVEDKVDPKTKLLSQLGRQNSSIINRLSEVQKDKPALMFDNSTNTDARHTRTQGVNTDQMRTREQKTNTTLISSDVMTREGLDAEVNERVKQRVKEQLDRAKKNFEMDLEDCLQERLQEEVEKLERKYKVEFEREVTTRVNEKVRLEMVRAKQTIEQDVDEEINTRVHEEVSKARKVWEASQEVKTPLKPLTRDRSVQAHIAIPQPVPEPVVVPKPVTRSVAAGEGKLTDLLCDKCTIPKKTVGCSWDKVTDLVCDTCKDRKLALSLKPMTKSSSMQTVPPVTKPTSNTFCQTLPVSLKNTATNTTFLALKKEDPVTSASSPVVTPETERRPFGSSGVKVCDKCHDTIKSVAKDFVSTTGTTPTGGAVDIGIPIIVPLPPTSGSSKIPRLVDPFKLDPKLEGDDLGNGQNFQRDSDLRRSDSRINQTSSQMEHSGGVELRRRKDQTPDLLSDSLIVRDARRNSGPPSAPDSTEKQKVPFNRQQTYTKLGEDGVSEEEEAKTARKMSTFTEEDEEEAAKSRKSSVGGVTRSIYRRERSSPEITMKESSWKRPERQLVGRSEEAAKVSSVSSKTETTSADAWQKEMTSYSRTTEENARSSRGTSMESNATYKVDEGAAFNRSSRRSPTPTSPTKGPASPSPPRKATPIPQQVAPPPNFPATASSSKSLQTPTTAATSAGPTPPSSSSASHAKPNQSPLTKTTSLPIQKPLVPSIVRTSPPPQPKPPQVADTKVTAPHPAPGTLAQASDMRLSTASVDDSELLDSGDESIVASSIVTQDSSVYGPSSGTSPQMQRKKAKLGRGLRAALKVLNDSIGKPVRSGQQLTNALNIIQRDWFKVSSQTDSNPHLVEDYLDIFEMQYSRGLLHRVVNLADVNGNTAMHYAVSHGNYDVVSLLLDSKVCSVNQQNKAGYTATMLVSLAPIKCNTHSSVVERLFSMSDVNVKADQHGQTALMLAVSHGRLDTVRLLLGAGADVNIQDDDGSTAVMCAAEHGHLAIVRFLLQCPDTDAHLVDNDGSSALAIAVEAGHKDVGVLLYKHMNLAARGSSPYSSLRGGKRSRTPTLPRSAINTPPPRFSAPPSPGRSRRSSNPPSPPSSHHNSPHTSRHKPSSSASLSNLNF